jgi:hypothetical protein
MTLGILPGIHRLAGIAVPRNAIVQTAHASEPSYALIEPKSVAPGKGSKPYPAHR